MKGYLFCQNCTQKGNGLGLEVEPPRIELRENPSSSPGAGAGYVMQIFTYLYSLQNEER